MARAVRPRRRRRLRRDELEHTMTEEHPRLAQLRAIAEKSKKPLASYGLAMEYRSHGRLEEAVAWFERVHAMDRDYVPAYFMRAQVLAERGQTDVARAALEAGIAAATRVGDDHALSEMRGMLDTLPD